MKTSGLRATGEATLLLLLALTPGRAMEFQQDGDAGEEIATAGCAVTTVCLQTAKLHIVIPLLALLTQEYLKNQKSMSCTKVCHIFSAEQTIMRNIQPTGGLCNSCLALHLHTACTEQRVQRLLQLPPRAAGAQQHRAGTAGAAGSPAQTYDPMTPHPARTHPYCLRRDPAGQKPGGFGLWEGCAAQKL